MNNINNAFNFIAQNDIKPEDVFALVEKVQTMNLEDEASIRQVIHEVAKLAHKPVDKSKEDKIVKEIMKNGINDNLFNLI